MPRWCDSGVCPCGRNDVIQDLRKDGYDDGGQPEPAPQMACEQCGKTFATNRALRAHQFQKHSRRSWARSYCDATGDCPACGGEFWTRPRAIVHLRRASPACGLKVQEGHVPRIPDEEVERLDALDAAAMRTAKREGRNPLEGRPARPAKRRRYE